jgi:hypothetical protein
MAALKFTHLLPDFLYHYIIFKNMAQGDSGLSKADKMAVDD